MFRLGGEMRYREDFSLYKRVLGSGKFVYYYMTYDRNGKRLCGHSTGKRTKGEARLFCNQLIREGKLIPEKVKIPTFEEFSKGWWIWDSCPYLLRRRARRALSRSYADIAKKVLDNHILPYFKNFKLDAITDVEVEDWLTSRKDEGSSNKSANLYLSILTVMLNEAVRKRIIKSNPASLVSKLKEAVFAVEILSEKEMAAIFPKNWKLVWQDEMVYVANKVAACTGLRIGEVVGLRGIDVFESYISVRGQFNKYGYTDTKNHKSRNIPLPPALQSELEKIKKRNGDGYLFSINGGDSPLNKDMLNRHLKAAFNAIGISEAERKRRHLTFHSWRHFFNTSLRLANVSDSKVRAVTGHGSNAMTEHYTHYDTREFQDVRQVQESLLGLAVRRKKPALVPTETGQESGTAVVKKERGARG